MHEYELTKNEKLFNEQLNFASEKALTSSRSQYFLPAIDAVKKHNNNSSTIGILNEIMIY